MESDKNFQKVLKYVDRTDKFETNNTTEQKQKPSAVSWSVAGTRGPHIVYMTVCRVLIHYSYHICPFSFLRNI